MKAIAGEVYDNVKHDSIVTAAAHLIIVVFNFYLTKRIRMLLNNCNCFTNL